eukprot:scaffold19949_cov120-Isochrysis_galbana.AAC.6
MRRPRSGPARASCSRVGRRLQRMSTWVESPPHQHPSAGTARRSRHTLGCHIIALLGRVLGALLIGRKVGGCGGAGQHGDGRPAPTRVRRGQFLPIVGGPVGITASEQHRQRSGSPPKGVPRPSICASAARWPASCSTWRTYPVLRSAAPRRASMRAWPLAASPPAPISSAAQWRLGRAAAKMPPREWGQAAVGRERRARRHGVCQPTAGTGGADWLPPARCSLRFLCAAAVGLGRNRLGGGGLRPGPVASVVGLAGSARARALGAPPPALRTDDAAVGRSCRRHRQLRGCRHHIRAVSGRARLARPRPHQPQEATPALAFQPCALGGEKTRLGGGAGLGASSPWLGLPPSS